MMLKLSKVIILTTSFFVSTCYAGYNQSIKLHQATINGGLRHYLWTICFTTTNLFDKYHCGNNQFTYPDGPKKWYILINPDPKHLSDRYKFDESCQIFKDYSTNTPSENGTLDIYATVDPLARQVSKCSAKWQSD